MSKINELLHEDTISLLNKFGFTEFIHKSDNVIESINLKGNIFQTHLQKRGSISGSILFLSIYDSKLVSLIIPDNNINIITTNFKENLSSIYYFDKGWAESEEDHISVKNSNAKRMTLGEILSMKFLDVLREEKLNKLI